MGLGVPVLMGKMENNSIISEDFIAQGHKYGPGLEFGDRQSELQEVSK